MREGYSLLKSIEILQNELQSTNDDEDNRVLIELIEQYHEQLKSYEVSFVETIATLRQIQMNINKFHRSCQEIEYTMQQQRTLFEQFIESDPNIIPDNFNQQIQVLKTLQREIETQTNSMIETLGQTTKETPVSQMKIQKLTDESGQLKLAILVSLSIRSKLNMFEFGFCRRKSINENLFSLNTPNSLLT